ncbi:RloB family protein [Enterococcus sp. HY326]|uniref:RloB family protein n=1 Tax=Enterococcus sp. HY326 TaxID=2971265 RepID=UPI00223FA9BD|nr:RloB family protein [Enterococcus sp. HY326]
MAKIGKKEKKKKKREPASYFIGSEGKKTEVIYFTKFSEMLIDGYEALDGKISIEDVPSFDIHGVGTSNFRLIEDVENYLRKSPKIYENIWILFDLDDIPLDYFDNAIESAKSKGYKVAWSNDSFELWYLLHFEYLQSAITRAQYQEKLDKYLQKEGYKGYSKTDEGIFDFLVDKTEIAISNSEKLLNDFCGCPCSKKNPCTNVSALVSELLSLKK